MSAYETGNKHIGKEITLINMTKIRNPYIMLRFLFKKIAKIKTSPWTETELFVKGAIHSSRILHAQVQACVMLVYVKGTFTATCSYIYCYKISSFRSPVF